MIYAHSLGRAARYYGERTVLSIGGNRLTFRELHRRVERIATGLKRRTLREHFRSRWTAKGCEPCVR
jgi:acyl-CoA synthetase (AMP-forming)/AMP-acid ligase II